LKRVRVSKSSRVMKRKREIKSTYTSKTSRKNSNKAKLTVKNKHTLYPHANRRSNL
jgi:hypothetical protein